MSERWIVDHQQTLLIVVGLAALLVVIVMAFSMDRFVGWAERAPDTARPHAFNPLNPGHCEVCWREGHRRRRAEMLAAAGVVVKPVPLSPRVREFRR